MRLKIIVLDPELSPRSQRRLIGLASIAIIIALAAAAYAAVPDTFSANQPISASAMNRNFESLDARLSALENRASSGPVGTIVASMLTLQEFIVRVPATETWVLANGSSNHQSTQWAAIKGTSQIPDLRGVFVRGANHERDEATGNPDASDLGDYQSDAFESHTHRIATGRDPNPGAESGCAFTGLLHSAAIFAELGNTCSGNALNYEGGAETRPRNVTVNYFIRVN